MFFDKKKTANRMLAAALLSFAVAGCGGGSSDSSDSSGTTVSGTASAPGGSVALYENRGLLYAVGSFLMPEASAEITGLQPVPGATVELIEIDNDGNQVGEVLASTTTSVTGDYQLSLPAGVNFAANLVLRITSVDENSTLDAQVVTQQVDIDPYSDYLLDKLIENGSELDSLAINEVVLLKGKLEEFDLTAGSDMSEMLALLEEATGEFVDNNIQAINNGAGDAAAIAGDYHLGEFGFGLHDSDAGQFGTFNSFVNLGSVTLADAGDENVQATINSGVLDVWYNLGYDGQGGGFLYLVSELEEEEQENGTVDGSGALVFESPFEEEIDTENDVGWRWPPITTRLEPVADTGVFVGRLTDAGVRYDLTEDGALDPDAKDGDEIENSFIILARKPTEASAALLNGNYGIVGMGAGAIHNSGVTEIEGFLSVTDFDGAGSLSDEAFDGKTAQRAPDSAPVELSDITTESGTYAVSSNGLLEVMFDDITDRGFVADDGNIIGVFFHENEETGEGEQTVITQAVNGMAIGVKLPDAVPDMGGRSYQLQDLFFAYDGTGTEMFSLTGAVITFNGDGSFDLSADKLRGVERGSDTANLEAVTEEIGELVSNQAVEIDDQGRLTATLDLDGEQIVLDGFVAASGDVLLLRSISSDESSYETGMFIGALTP